MTARAGFVSPPAWTCLRCHSPHFSCEGFLSNPYIYCVPTKSPSRRCFNFWSKQVLRFKSSILASFPTCITFSSRILVSLPHKHLLLLRLSEIPLDKTS
jgi:hypothetical protein